MKNILIPVEAHSAIESTLTSALILARRFTSHIEGVALGPDIPDLVAFDMPVSWTITDQNAWRELQDEARQQFETFMSTHNISTADPGAPGLGCRFLPDRSLGDSQAASYARVFDLTVVGRPGAERGDPRMATAEALIFESGRPILLAPPRPPEKIGETVVISWNRSTETASCVALAMPLLQHARKVYVLTLENFMVEGPTGEECAERLAVHGIPVEAVTRSSARPAGEAVLNLTAELGGDLLIKGAFTQSRLRQMIFGGPTAHIMANAQVPVFMAN